ncbi:MAG: DUF1294 domain-containing protein [Lachnospiraceae bacterium]|nr:DUF1294 domain-containing protein [Lachnospiraceae bacterium]
MEKIIIMLLIAYIVIMSIVGFFSMFADKRKAEKHAWRTPEATLFLIAYLGGGIGSTLGMWTFRHKTKHWYFVIGFPIAAIIYIAVLAILVFRVLA